MRAAELLAVCLCAVPIAASGEDDAAQVAREDQTPPPPTPELELSGRVFARAQADGRADYRRDLSVPSARFQVKASYGVAQAVVEADVATSSLIKDAYIRLADKDRGLRLYAGQFKAPFLQRKMMSTWDLPFVERGLVSDYLTDTQDLGGRRIGVLGELKRKAWLGLDLQLGVFRGAEDALGERLGEDLSARASFEPWRDHLEVGAYGYWAQLNAEGRFDRWAAGGDATVSFGGARVTTEGVFGQVTGGHFTAQLVTASWLLPLDAAGQWAVEPVVGAEGLQQRGEVSGSGRAAVLGVNLHYAERVKLMVQGERGLFPGDDGLQNRFAVQLAARF